MMDLSKFTSNKKILSKVVAKFCPLIFIKFFYYDNLKSKPMCLGLNPQFKSKPRNKSNLVFCN